MNLLSFLSLFTCVFWSAPSYAFPSALTYAVNESPTLPLNRILDSIHGVLTKSEFLLYRSNQTNRPSPDWLDQVYGNDSFSSLVLVKVGIRPTSEKFIGTPISHPDGELLHLKIDKDTHVALFFYGVSPQQVENLTFRLKTEVSRISSPASSWLDVLLPKAHAEECLTSKVNPSTDFKEISAKIERTQQASSVGACMAKMWEGLRESVVGQATSILNFNAQLKVSPREAWSSIVNSGKNLYQFASTLKDQIMKGAPELIDAIGLLDADLICSLVGELGPDVLLIVAGGYTTAKLTIAITKYVQRLRAAAKFLAYIARVKALTGKSELPAGFLKRLIRGDIAAEALQTIERATSRGLHALARGAAQCTN